MFKRRTPPPFLFSTVTHIIAAVKQSNTMISCSGSLLFNQTHSRPTRSSTHRNNKCGQCPALCFSFTDPRGRAVSNCTLDLIGSAVQCTAVEADKSFFQSLEKWLPTEWSEDTGRDKEFIVSWLVFELYCNCEGAHW